MMSQIQGGSSSEIWPKKVLSSSDLQKQSVTERKDFLKWYKCMQCQRCDVVQSPKSFEFSSQFDVSSQKQRKTMP